MNRQRKRPRRQASLSRSQLYGWLFILPWVIGCLLFVLWPLCQSFFFSLNRVRVTPGGRIFQFIGMNNYLDIWAKDLFFLEELTQFAVSTVLRTPVIVIFALVIALLLNQKIRCKALFRTVFFLPVVIASGPVMEMFIRQGVTTVSVNTDSLTATLETMLPMWLVTPLADLFSQIIMILWYSGIQILIFLAALQKVDPSLYEAARIDGGSTWTCFWKITLPTIKPMILLNAVYTVVSLANSDQNPVISLIYTNMFEATKGYGNASAMAWMYGLIDGAILALVYMILRPKRDRTGKEDRACKHRRLLPQRKRPDGARRNSRRRAGSA